MRIEHAFEIVVNIIAGGMVCVIVVSALLVARLTVWIVRTVRRRGQQWKN